MSGDRITYDDNGDSLDEIVLSGVTFHMERMSHHGWWIGVTSEDGRSLRICWSATGEPLVEQDGEQAVEVEVCGPLLYHDGSLWTDGGVEHRCELGRRRDGGQPRANHPWCRCECGATRRRI